MKKLLTLLFAVVTVSANAQIFEKGDWYLNAQATNLNFLYASVDDISAIELGIATNVGYFLSNKFAVDASLGLEYLKFKDIDGSAYFKFGAGVSYYPIGNFFARA